MSAQSKTENNITRPPVIVVMGHIDHGKSKLLDYIRKSHVVESEAGGITQHISAYEVEHEKDGEKHRITFLDTPGHEAFSGMRARGAQVADIAILVVAADDGVNTQTVEALEAIKGADVPYVVAINKIDKPDADINKTIQSLIEHEVYVEGYGGDIPYAKISAKEGDGVDELLDILLLVAELEELSANPNTPAEGVVIETRLDPKKGISATLVITSGTIKQGMHVVAEKATSPVRIMEDFSGKKISEATFSSPIMITGFNETPNVGARFKTFEKRKDAEKYALEYGEASTKQEAEVVSDDIHTIPVVVKGDVVGTQEALMLKLKELETERVKLKIVHTGIGTITEGDVKLAGTSENAYIIGFNVDIERTAEELAERMGVKTQTSNIIYELIEWFEKVVEEETPREETEVEIGRLKVLKTFSQVKDKQVIGGKVSGGVIKKGARFNIMRRNENVGVGKINGIQQQKSSVSEAHEGGEAGLEVESKTTIAESDHLSVFVIEKR